VNAITLTLYDKSGSSLGEFIDAEFKSALWRFGRTGTASYSFSPKGSKTSRSNLRPGNRALIKFADGLPDWGGILDWPIILGSGRDVEISFYEADHLLDWRVSGQNEVFSGTVTGAIISALMQTANATYATGIYMGDIYSGGTAHTRDYHYVPLLDAIRDLHNESGYDYAVMPVLVNGKLVFDLYWYESRGTDRRDNLALIEGVNVGEISVAEQGPIYNRIIVIGKGDDWSSSRPVKFAESTESRSYYGLRESPKFYLDIDDATTLQAIADALLAASEWPYVRMTLTGVTDDDPAPFSTYHIGDILILEALQTYGEFSYNIPVRILARERLADGTCTLEVEEWRD
jgi:hypothetical protein